MGKSFVFAAAALIAALGAPAHAGKESATGAKAHPVASEARAMLARLVSFRSVAGSPGLFAMADYLAGEFRRAGFEERDIEFVRAGGSVGLIVRYRPRGPSRRAPVLFLSHMDVVDAKATEWASDPWQLTERQGALYGRGAVDNKYGLVTQALAFIRLKREGFSPARELILAFSGDEETEMATTQALAERLRGAAFAINSDAGGGYRGGNGKAAYSIQAGEKTYATFELTVRNDGGHSSRPRPDNAIYELARVLPRIEQHIFPARWNKVTLDSFRALLPTLPAEVATPLAAFIANPSEGRARAVAAAEAGLAPELRTTCVATMLRAGSAENALATEATATVNCRIFPGETVADTRAILERVAAQPGLEVRTLGEPKEGPVSDVPPDASAALAAVLAVRAPAAAVSPYLEVGATDGLHFRRAGIPTVGMGPLFAGEDSNYNYHGIDERLPLAEFEEGLDHYFVMMRAVAGR